MSGLDVEALLDSTAPASDVRSDSPKDGRDRDDRRSEREREREREDERRRDRDRDRRHRDRSNDRSRKSSRDRHKERDGEEAKEEVGSNGYHRRRRSRSRDSDKRYRRYRDEDDRERRGSGDYYRRRSRSPNDDRYYRPAGGRERSPRRERSRERERDRRDRRHSRSPRRKTKSPTPQPTEDERDRRTVFVQQLAARLRTKELIAFFDKVGPVKEAQIVKDRVSGRSKGVGYVEFKNEESVPLAIQLTGQKLLGIPIIAQLTEAEKNRQARTTEGGGNTNSIPFHRLYVGNIHFSITEQDLQNVFEPFGELEFVQLQKEEHGRSRGYGFVQFRDPTQAREALEKMNGFDLAGRPIRVGLGNDKFTPESTNALLQRFTPDSNGRPGAFQGSAFSGSGGRGAHAGGSGGNFDRAGGRDDQKGSGGASALDDTDVAGVNFNNYSRDALMRKLARTEEPEPVKHDKVVKKPDAKPLPVNVNHASRCIKLSNMFDPNEEESESNWVRELEDDVKAECEQKYGHVTHISLDPTSFGDIWVKFSSVSGGEKAMQGLNGRFFGGRQITASPIVDAVYSTMFARTKAM